MTDKKRFAKLISDFPENDICFCDVCDRENSCRDCESERMADYLISHGVIVLPCKVGDEVYCPWVCDNNKGVAFAKVESIKIYTGMKPLFLVDYLQSDMPLPIMFIPEDIGKTVYLTREEAEKALEDMKK